MKVRDGVLESEQIRRAIDNGLRKKGVSAEADRKRASRASDPEPPSSRLKRVGDLPSSVVPATIGARRRQETSRGEAATVRPFACGWVLVSG